MGMCENMLNGYGVRFGRSSGTNTTPEKIRTLLEFAPLFKEEMMEYFEDIDVVYENATVDDFESFEQDYYTGIPYIIARVINEKYKEEFMEAMSDDDCFLYLYYPAQMPWDMSEFEKELTKEKITSIIEECWNILYDSGVCVDFVSIRNFG